MSVPAVTHNSQMQQAAYTVSLKSVRPQNDQRNTARAQHNAMASAAPKQATTDTVTISSKAREMATTQGAKT